MGMNSAPKPRPTIATRTFLPEAMGAVSFAGALRTVCVRRLARRRSKGKGPGATGETLPAQQAGLAGMTLTSLTPAADTNGEVRPGPKRQGSAWGLEQADRWAGRPLW